MPRTAQTRTETSPAAAITVGATVQLTASIQEADAGGHRHAVTWDSNNTNAATVDKNGLVTGVAFGVATVTASTQGKSGSALVTVLP